jgi:hypothetical protein
VGYWSIAIFGNDLASDVRATYRELLEDGIPDDQALLKVEQEFAYAADDPDNRAAFWTALAATQMRLGRLDSRVRDQTIAVIDSGGDLHMWEGSDVSRRKAALTKLRDQLLGPQKRPVRVRPPKREPSPVQAGDIFMLGLADGREARFRTLGVHSYRVGDVPIVEMIDEGGRPYRDGIRALVALRQDVPIRVVGHYGPPQKVAMPDVSCSWRALQFHAAKLLSDPDARPKRGLFH